MKANEIYKTYGRNYKTMTKCLLEESKLCDRIPADAKIGIKPNLVSPTPAEYGATTHPEVVAGIIEYLKEHGFSRMVILEGSWIGDKTEDAYEYCGYRQLIQDYDIPFIDAQKEASTPVDCQGLQIKICNAGLDIDYMINVPVLKGHGQTKITCALKNMKGLIPNSEKRHFHTLGLHEPIAHLSRGLKQDFIVVDHICGDLELEDGGNPIETNCVMTALDPVLVDAYVCHLLGYEVSDVPYVGLAEQLGSGSTDLKHCQIRVFDFDIMSDKELSGKELYDISDRKCNKKCGEKSAEATDKYLFKKADEASDETSGEHSDSQSVEQLNGSAKSGITTFGALEYDPYEEKRCPSENLMDISYAIEDADSCSACYASLAPAILRLKEDGLYQALLDRLACMEDQTGVVQKNNSNIDMDYSACGNGLTHKGKIAIGQGFSGKSGCFGVGNCCRNFDFYVPGCPPEEEDVYQRLLSIATHC